MARPKVKFVKALWGMESTPHPEAAKRIAQSGFAAIETPAASLADATPFWDEGLGVVAMLFPMSIEDLKVGLANAARLDPILINVHAGKDWWTLEEGVEFFQQAVRLSSPAPVCFETHRGRLLHEPFRAKELMESVPELRVTADLSHWTCVCESLLDDQAEAMDLTINRTRYIHARVGHEEGPQVPDPRAAEWSGHVERFCQWWDKILDKAGDRGQETMHVDVEFGPPNYLWTRPGTREPLADLWEVCVWMKDHLNERWS